MNALPIATRWLLDAVGPTGRQVVDSVFMIVCPKTSTKGTGFLLDTGYLITNHHVVDGSNFDEVRIISGRSHLVQASGLRSDPKRDLCALEVGPSVAKGLRIDTLQAEVGTQVGTWGFPLGYNGPAPLLTLGHLSGFAESTSSTPGAAGKKHLVINAAFNPGNSGGPLFVAGRDGVIGVVVSKHAPISAFLASAIKALAENKSGVVFTYTDTAGKAQQFVESQVVAEILLYFRDMTQVVIGEAIAASELIGFLDEGGIPWNPTNGD